MSGGYFDFSSFDIILIAIFLGALFLYIAAASISKLEFLYDTFQDGLRYIGILIIGVMLLMLSPVLLPLVLIGKVGRIIERKIDTYREKRRERMNDY